MKRLRDLIHLSDDLRKGLNLTALFSGPVEADRRISAESGRAEAWSRWKDGRGCRQSPSNQVSARVALDISATSSIRTFRSPFVLGVPHLSSGLVRE